MMTEHYSADFRAGQLIVFSILCGMVLIENSALFRSPRRSYVCVFELVDKESHSWSQIFFFDPQ